MDDQWSTDDPLYKLAVIQAWAERDPAIAEAMRVMDQHQAKDLDEEDRYWFPDEMYLTLKEGGSSSEYVLAIEKLRECVERGFPPGVQS